MGVSLRRYVSPIYLMTGCPSDDATGGYVARCVCVTVRLRDVDADHVTIERLLDDWQEWSATAATWEDALQSLRRMLATDHVLTAREARTLPIHQYPYEDVLRRGGPPLYEDFLAWVRQAVAPRPWREGVDAHPVG
jgi:hypothetical protein